MQRQLDGKEIGHVFGAPVTIKGWEVLPLAERVSRRAKAEGVAGHTVALVLLSPVVVLWM